MKKKSKRRSKDSEHYVNNKEFFTAMVAWKEEVSNAEASGDPKPPVTEYIGSCFLKIAEHLSYKPNFINYPFRDEMICDGIENCIMYCSNFDPEKSTNPFSYFTQIIYFAFLRRIQKEKKQNYIKYKLTMNSSIYNRPPKWVEEMFEDSDDDVSDPLADALNLSENDISKFEPKKKKKSKKKNLDVFLEDDKSEDSPDK